MTIKAIEARFTSGNDIPVQKAMVTADEWKAVKAEIEKRDAMLRVALDALERALSDDKSYIMEGKAAIKAIREVLK